MKQLLVIVIVLLILYTRAAAEGFEWRVNCVEADESARLHYWIGYESSADLPDSYFGYIGNGPGFYMDAPLAGIHDYAIEVLLPSEDSAVTIWLYPQDISISISSATEAVDCVAVPLPSPVTYDDQGVVNNPFVNERANACYEPGQACGTDAEWGAGWYLIRQQYGLI